MSKKFASLRHQAPEELRATIQDLLDARGKKKIVLNLQFGNWFGAALAVAAVVCFIFWSSLHHGPSDVEVTRQEIVSSHIRSIMGEHIFDVASTDSHTVKPWFNGKIDFSPQVIDLKEAGFPLVGGRLDYVDSRTVAALVYKRDKHFINLFVWPTHEATLLPVLSVSQGFNMWHWQNEGMTYFAVSDLNPNSLREFVNLLGLAPK